MFFPLRDVFKYILVYRCQAPFQLTSSNEVQLELRLLAQELFVLARGGLGCPEWLRWTKVDSVLACFFFASCELR